MALHPQVTNPAIFKVRLGFGGRGNEEERAGNCASPTLAMALQPQATDPAIWMQRSATTPAIFTVHGKNGAQGTEAREEDCGGDKNEAEGKATELAMWKSRGCHYRRGKTSIFISTAAVGNI
jgi:hypothetical protein